MDATHRAKLGGLGTIAVLFSIFMVKSHQQEIHKRSSGRGQFRETLSYIRARIISLFTMLTFGLQPLSSLFIGYMAEWAGTQTIIMFNAVCLASGAALMLFLRQGLWGWELKPAVEPILSSSEREASSHDKEVKRISR